MKSVLYCLALLALAACAMHGPLSAPVAAGAASVLAVFDQMLADQLITPEQYLTLSKGVGSIGDSLTAVQVAVDSARRIAEEAKAGGVSPETLTGGLSGTALAVLAAIRAWRGPSTKAAKPTGGDA